MRFKKNIFLSSVSHSPKSPHLESGCGVSTAYSSSVRSQAAGDLPPASGGSGALKDKPFSSREIVRITELVSGSWRRGIIKSHASDVRRKEHTSHQLSARPSGQKRGNGTSPAHFPPPRYKCSSRTQKMGPGSHLQSPVAL